jgi:hypothetical protein
LIGPLLPGANVNTRDYIDVGLLRGVRTSYKVYHCLIDEHVIGFDVVEINALPLISTRFESGIHDALGTALVKPRAPIDIVRQQNSNTTTNLTMLDHTQDSPRVICTVLPF